MSEMTDQDQMIKTRRIDGSHPGGGAAEAGPSPRSLPSARRSTTRTQDIDRQVGARVRERRIMLGLTQQQLAKNAGVSVGLVRDLEQGRTTRPHRESVRRLASGDRNCEIR